MNADQLVEELRALRERLRRAEDESEIALAPVRPIASMRFCVECSVVTKRRSEYGERCRKYGHREVQRG